MQPLRNLLQVEALRDGEVYWRDVHQPVQKLDSEADVRDPRPGEAEAQEDRRDNKRGPLRIEVAVHPVAGREEREPTAVDIVQGHVQIEKLENLEGEAIVQFHHPREQPAAREGDRHSRGAVQEDAGELH